MAALRGCSLRRSRWSLPGFRRQRQRRFRRRTLGETFIFTRSAGLRLRALFIACTNGCRESLPNTVLSLRPPFIETLSWLSAFAVMPLRLLGQAEDADFFGCWPVGALVGRIANLHRAWPAWRGYRLAGQVITLSVCGLATGCVNRVLFQAAASRDGWPAEIHDPIIAAVGVAG
jgi:hypothetical protein